jgi:hypothetical protein
MSDKTQPETELLLNGVAYTPTENAVANRRPAVAGNGDCSSAFS